MLIRQTELIQSRREMDNNGVKQRFSIWPRRVFQKPTAIPCLSSYQLSSHFPGEQRNVKLSCSSKSDSHQHRFTGLKSGDFFKKTEAIYKELPPLVSADAAGMISTITGYADKVIDAIKSVVGHYLHTFLDEGGIETANNIYRNYMKTRESKLKEANEKLKQLESALKRQKAVDDPNKLMPDIEDLNLAVLEKEDVFLLSLQIVESAQATAANKEADEEMKKRWLAQIETLKKVAVQGHEPFPLDEFIVTSGRFEMDTKIDKFIKNTESLKLFKEMRNMCAAAIEIQNRIVHKGADQSMALATQMQAEVNGIPKISREDLKKYLATNRLRKPKSDDHLDLTKSTERSGQNRSQVQKAAGLAPLNSKNIERNFPQVAGDSKAKTKAG